MSLIKDYSEIDDAVSFAIYCVSDPSIMIVFREDEYIMPRLKLNGSISETVANEVKEILGEVILPLKIGCAVQIWAPQQTKDSVMHYVFGYHCTLEQKKKAKNTAGKYRNQVRWLTEQEVKQAANTESMHDPFIPYMYQVLKENKYPDLELIKNAEFLQYGTYFEVTEKCVMIPFGNPKSKNIYEQLIDAAGISPLVQIAIYKEFLTLSYPSALMSCNQFSKAVMPLGWPKDDCVHLFRAADMLNRRSLTPKEFIYIMAALDPATNHGGGAAEVRSRYIFKFFDRDRDGFMNFNELKTLVIYMRKIKNQSLDMNSIEKDMEGVCRSLSFTTDTKMPLLDFLQVVSELKIRGLSQVLRTSKGMKTTLKAAQEKSSLVKLPAPKQAESAGFTIGVKGKSNTVQTTLAKSAGDYEVAVHTVKMQRSGTMINLDLLFNLTNAVSATTLLHANITEKSRRTSLDVYGQNTLCNELIRTLRMLVRQNNVRSGNRGNRKEAWMWGTTNCAQFAERLMLICEQCKLHIKTEPRMVEVRTPAYIMGDLHGNYGDLMFLEKMFWPLSPGICPATLLFLGDFVDRGAFAVEVITYLFCYKVMFPHKLKLVRGNHEIREIQKLFTFREECIQKFGDKLGRQMWESINDVFDYLPIAALVDGKIFCVHGGIPPPWLCPSAAAINSVMMPLPRPDEQSSLAWEIMWNDPIKDQFITEDLKVELLANDGFAKNAKRGTGHVFSQLALDRFLNLNGFTHIIRAHEVQGCGFNVQLKGRLLTVFSSSRYGNQQNESACILADSRRLRMLRLDTNS